MQTNFSGYSVEYVVRYSSDAIRAENHDARFEKNCIAHELPTFMEHFMTTAMRKEWVRRTVERNIDGHTTSFIG